jgi:putative ABC transport system permease protein
VLVGAALPLFRVLADRPLALDAGIVAPAVLVAAALAVGVGLLAGSYPALVLSGFRPAEVLRGRFSASGRGARLRQGLVVCQFAIAVVLIIGTLGVYTQLRYLREADLHFDVAQVVSLPIPTDSLGGVAFLEALRRRPEVLAAAASGEDLPSDLLDGDGVALPGSDDPDAFASTRTVSVGHGFFDVLGVSFVAGRDFRAGSAPDSAGVVFNEAAARLVLEKMDGRVAAIEGLVGEELMGSQGRTWTVLGIVEDFNMATLHDAVEPVAFYVLPGRYDTFLARVAPGSAAATVESLRSVFTEVYPDALFEYRFTDAAFDAAYRNEERLGQLFMVFAGLAVFIACLGLFGLAAYAAERRTKEIGVRKVLGATVGSIVGLLSKDFAKLVVAAIVVAAPVAWFAMDRWLEGFAYRVGLSPLMFVLAGVLALAIALATVSAQALRAASTDPVRALRYE